MQLVWILLVCILSLRATQLTTQSLETISGHTLLGADIYLAVSNRKARFQTEYTEVNKYSLISIAQ